MPAVRAEVQVVDDPAETVAERLVAADGHVVLTGGSTPRKAYERAAELRHDWTGTTLWFSDERCVPPEDGNSNYRMVNEALLRTTTGAEVKRMEGERGPDGAAGHYAGELGAVFAHELPEFDLMLLGIGPDAHLCSLFPDAPALDERDAPVVGVEEAGMEPLVPRVTLTLPVVDAARELIFLVTGEGKADALARALGEPDHSAPSSLVQSGSAKVVCDAVAASRL
jgi:6-phosphogluconolactonase